ncbi:MAG TPA: beta-propeller domain-containing protein [Acidimicrobiales bacterium]|nr:beta-propeller domain-containing protein [Acidimicrobiales bacterium]
MLTTTRTGRTRRTAATVVTAAVVALAAGCTGRAEIVQPPDTGRPRFVLASALVPFDACGDALAYLKDGARRMGLVGGSATKWYAVDDKAVAGTAGSGSAAVAREAAPATTAVPAPAGAVAQAFSTTNVQEAGADEPDVVKTDGRYLYTIAGSALVVVDVGPNELREVASLDLGDRGYGYGAQLLLAGDRLLVVWPSSGPSGGGRVMHAPITVPAGTAVRGNGTAPGLDVGGLATAVTVVSVADPSAPAIVGDLSLGGSLVSARLVDGVAKLILRSGPPQALYGATGPAEDARKTLEQTTLDDWLPRYSYTAAGRTTSGRLTDCREMTHPADFAGVDMVSVVAVDPADPRPGPAASVVGAGDVVYATPEHLYVTSTTWTPGSGAVPFTPMAGPATKTAIHEFDIADKVRTTYLASGEVDGRVLNQFSLSEHNGDLRIATTRDDAAESQVAVLRRDGDHLAQIGIVGGLGQHEKIYAVRFLGDLAYVVTFRQTDPLYVVDLADPTNPVVRGELKIPGYSAYLHPIGAGLLLGLGQGVPEAGPAMRLGTQLSVFDVSDPAAPARLSQVSLGPSQSAAEYDHHAFLWWPKENLAVIPLAPWSQFGAPTSQVVGFTVTRDGIAERGRLAGFPGDTLRRTVVIGDRVLALGDRGVVAGDVASFTEQARLTF